MSKNQKKIKLSPGEKCRLLAEAVAHYAESELPQFPVNYLVLKPKPGVCVPLIRNEDDSVTLISPVAIAHEILKYCNKYLRYTQDFGVLPKQAQEIANYFLAIKPAQDPREIKFVRWLDEPGLTYRRLPWIREGGPTPTWDNLLLRMSNSKSFKDWMGSILYEEAHRHNYLYVYGEGGDGKGAINNCLKKALGEQGYRSKTAPTIDRNGKIDKFWAYNLIGARLAIFPDCENPNFTTTGFFKSLTGGDPIEVEGKNLNAFTTELQTRYGIFANVKPAITSAKSDMRRIIYCEMEPNNEIEPGTERAFEQALWDEFGCFLSKCADQYISNYPTHGQLMTDQEGLWEIIDENEQYLENFFNKYFKLSLHGHVTGKDMQNAAEEAWPRQRKTHRAFLSWLKRVHNITVKKTKQHNIYNGLELKIAVSRTISCTNDTYNYGYNKIES